VEMRRVESNISYQRQAARARQVFHVHLLEIEPLL